MSEPEVTRRWVLEGFRGGGVVQRWECDGLEDEVVATYLGWVPQALWDVGESFFDYLMNRYESGARYADFDEVLIGTERSA